VTTARFGTGSNRLANLQTTEVYDSYWRFAAERQAIFFRRLEGALPPWSDDAVLRRHKFTNAYRASDRVSQFLIRHVIYGDGAAQDPAEIIFRILLFKLFNKIETWRLLEREIGTPTWASFKRAQYDKVLSSAFAAGQRLYSAAYIIPPVRLDGTDGVKHRGHLMLLERMMKDRLPTRLAKASSLRAIFEALKTYPSIGDFLGFQLAIDINYSEAVDHPEDEFVVAGPGALDGLAKCFANARDYDPTVVIAYVADRQDLEFDRLGLNFRSLWGRPLQLIDCQNLFCEISKYARVAHPDVAGVSGRTRIKQIFQPSLPRLGVWYPPKWGLNDKLPPAEAAPDDLFERSPGHGPD
jgi:hypothetical protein